METIDYKQKIKDYMNSSEVDTLYKSMLNNLFPELRESEDEKIRKHLLYHFRNKTKKEWNGIPIKDIIAWFEKQVSEPNWCHHNVDLSNCSEEYRKAYYDGWNNCNMQHSQCKSELDDVIKCLINGMKFYYEDNKEATWGTDKWSMPVKHIIEVLEQILANSAKTCNVERKPADKVEPKFHKDDWIVHHGTENIYQVVAVIDNQYLLKYGDNYTVQNCADVDRCARLWNASDAKDGDVLCTYECGKPKIVFILKGMPKKPYVLGYYCYYNIMYPNLEIDSEKGCLAPNDEDIKPATKEQRDLLFQKIKENGYEWDAEKKELKKIEQKPQSTWKPSDEQMKALGFYIKTYVDTEGSFGSEVLELYEQLKKLKK